VADDGLLLAGAEYPPAVIGLDAGAIWGLAVLVVAVAWLGYRVILASQAGAGGERNRCAYCGPRLKPSGGGHVAPVCARCGREQPGRQQPG
jgi:hypothetical protein